MDLVRPHTPPISPRLVREGPALSHEVLHPSGHMQGTLLLSLLVTTDALFISPTTLQTAPCMRSRSVLQQRTAPDKCCMQTLADTEMLGVVPEWLALPGTVLGVFNVVVAMALGNSFKLFKDGDGAPFVPTASEKLKSLFSGETGCLRPDGQALNLSTCADLHLIDLGSGTGSIVRAATRIGGFGRASGYELNPLLYQLSVVASLGRANEHFHLVSLWDADLGTADVVVVYGYPSFIEPLGIQLASELKDGALVVSNAYPIPNCVPHLELLNEIPVETPVWSPDASSSLWLYRVSRRSEDDTVPSTAMAAAGVPRRAAAQQHRTGPQERVGESKAWPAAPWQRSQRCRARRSTAMVRAATGGGGAINAWGACR